ncbi:MAG TPA: flagellar cap protein FliD N-terminal domain-containing protein, partial [Leptolinea sp.]
MATSSISNLDSYYQNLINLTLNQEKVPVTNLTKQKDDITLKKSVYTDLKSKFETLKTAIDALRSSQTSYALKAGRSVSVSPATSGTTVATASVASSVSAGTYALTVTKLAKAQEVQSTRQTYADQGLNLLGSFVIGGAAIRSASITTALPDVVTSVGANGSSQIATGQKELGTGAYYIETRKDDSAGWQFRLVDADGDAQNIRSGASTDFTANWQSISTSGDTYDTGRGLSVNFGTNADLFTASNKSSGAAKLDYEAQGATINVTHEMSLVDINSAINGATYAEGNEIVSSIIDNTLVMKNQSTGVAHVMQASEGTGGILASLGVLTGGLINTTVSAVDASFSVNNMPMTR